MLDAGLDQAAGLRRLVAGTPPGLLAFPLAHQADGRWIARLAHAMRDLGRRPVVMDAAGGTLTAAFGLRPRHDLIDLLRGERAFDAVAGRTGDGIHVLRAERGVEAFVAAGESRDQLLGGLLRLSHGFDAVLLAMPPAELASLAGPGAGVPVISLGGGPRAAVNSYSLAKQLAEGFGYRQFACVVDGAADAGSASRDHAGLAAVMRRFLDCELALAGWLPAAGANPGAGLALAAQTLLDVATVPLASGHA